MMRQDLERIDWALLRKQKLSLLDLRDWLPGTSSESNEREYIDAITGILHLVDGVQDSAVASGIEEEIVFGEQTDA